VNVANLKRLLVMIILACFVLLTLSAGIFTLLHAGHDCVGRTCTTCPAIKHSVQLVTGVTTALFAGLNLVISFALIRNSRRLVFTFANPVEIKARMNN